MPAAAKRMGTMRLTQAKPETAAGETALGSSPFGKAMIASAISAILDPITKVSFCAKEKLDARMPSCRRDVWLSKRSATLATDAQNIRLKINEEKME